jgi:hypothetical protein
MMFMEASSQPQAASRNSGKTGLQGYSAFFVRSLDSASCRLLLILKLKLLPQFLDAFFDGYSKLLVQNTV